MDGETPKICNKWKHQNSSVNQVSIPVPEPLPRRTIIFCGDTGSGKTTFGSCADVLQYHPEGTNYQHFRTTEKSVELNSIVEWEVVLTVCELGAYRVRGEQSPKKIYPEDVLYKCSNSAALGFFCDASMPGGAKRMWQRWMYLIPILFSNAQIEPFVFIVDTHCDQLSKTQRWNRRIFMESQIYERFGYAMLYFQVDARDRNSCSKAMDEVIKQLYYQKKR